VKRCSRCNTDRDKSEFAKRMASKDGLNFWCRSCFKQYRLDNKDHVNRRQKAYRDKNRERVRAWDREKSRRYTLAKYGLTETDYEQIVETQSGKCRICRCVPADRLVVDHCHDTGIVRGLLCRTCNSAIGQLSDSPLLLRTAADYLESTDNIVLY
jgi:hypothetical protein